MSEPTLKLIVLKTTQIESLREFYARLGFRFEREQHGNGPRHFSARLGDGVLEIYPLTSGATADTTTRLGFAIEGVQSIVESVSEFVEVKSNPKQTEWGLRAVVRDPDGRSIELYESSQSSGVTNA